MKKKKIYKKECEHCRNSFEALRSDAKFCSKSCRNIVSRKNREKERAEQNRIAQLQESIDKVNTEITDLKLKKENAVQYCAGEGERKKQALFLPKLSMFKAQRELRLSDIDLFNQYYNVAYIYAQENPEEIKRTNINPNFDIESLKYGDASSLNKEDQLNISKHRVGLTEKIEALQEELNAIQNRTVPEPDEIRKQCDELILTKEEEVKQLQLEITNPNVPVSEPENQIDSSITKDSTPKKKGITGTELFQMNFETFQLPGELGRFLGELERNKMAVALTGDSNAGKSYFSFQLAKLFLDYTLENGDKWKVKYYSLEDGIGEGLLDKAKTYNLNLNNITIIDDGTIEDIENDTKEFDVIIVDSYTILTDDPKEFQRLRSQYPETIFVFIFQKTTAGTVRGGSSVKFNSTAMINIEFQEGQRCAVMTKSRYGTEQWVYSIDKDKIIVGDKPIF